MKKHILSLTIVMLSFFILFSCSPPATSSPSGSNGSLAISINDSVSSSEAPAVGGPEEDIFPTISMDPASYHIAGLGPNGATFEETTTGNSLVVNALAFGDWTLTITALNADTTSIGVGSSTTTVNSNATSMVNVIVRPYDGLGTLDLSLAWTASDVNTPQIESTLQPNAGLTRNLDFTVAGASASFSADDVPTGYHTLVVKLLDNGILTMGAVDVVRIVADNTTSGSFLFDKINKATGTIEVGITPEMGDPLTVEIAGAADTKPENQSMSLTASVTNYANNVNYVWYVNGDSVETGSTFDFDDSWAQGYYRIDVTAYNTDGSRAGSDSVFVEVVERGITPPVGEAFVTVWKTDNPGDTGDNQIRLPLISGGNFNFEVDWGDGTSDTITSENDPEITHTYPTPGIYTVEITGELIGWCFLNAKQEGDPLKILEIKNWGGFTFYPYYTSYMNGEFQGCVNLIITATDIPDLSNVESLYETFSGCLSLIDIPNINNWDISTIKRLSHTFFRSGFNGDISDWDTSNVIIMANLFGESPFNGDISDWDTSNVTYMGYMFKGATSFNQDISNWDTSNVTNMYGMFADASSFNQDISGWNTTNVNMMTYMFLRAISFNQDISGWDTSNVTAMTGMFSGATSFDQDLSNWVVTAISRIGVEWDLINMFSGVTLSTVNYDAILIAWEAQDVPNNLSFDGGNSQYSSGAAAEARQGLIYEHGWRITDGGQTP